MIVIGGETAETESEANSENDSYTDSSQESNKAKESGNIISEEVFASDFSKSITVGVDSDSLTYSISRENIKSITFC